MLKITPVETYITRVPFEMGAKPVAFGGRPALAPQAGRHRA